MSTSGRPSVTTIVCSTCAASAPSAVRIVQPSPPGADARPAGAEDRLDRDHEPGVQPRRIVRDPASSGPRAARGSCARSRARPSSSSTATPRAAASPATASLIARTGAPATAARHATGERRVGRRHEPARSRRGGPDRHGDAGVGVEAVELGGDVELDEVAAAQAPAAGHAVHRLVVDADEDLARGVVDELRRRPRAVAREHPARDGIELGGGDPRLDAPAQLAQHDGDHVARPSQPFQLFLGLDRHRRNIVHAAQPLPCAVRCAARRSSPRSAPPRATPRCSCGWSRPAWTSRG